MFGQQRSLFSTGASTTNLFGGGTAAPTGFSQQQQQPSMFSTGGFGGLFLYCHFLSNPYGI
jgi:hypothetical protein